MKPDASPALLFLEKWGGRDQKWGVFNPPNPLGKSDPVPLIHCVRCVFAMAYGSPPPMRIGPNINLHYILYLQCLVNYCDEWVLIIDVFILGREPY